MTWAKDKEKIMSILMGIITAGLIGAGAMLIAHEGTLNANDQRINSNKEQIQRVERSTDHRFEIIDSKLDQIIREMK